MAVSKGDIVSTEGIIFVRNKRDGAAGIIKIRGGTKECLTQIFVANPEQIKGCDKIKVVEIRSAYTARHLYKGHWYTNMNVLVTAMPAESSYRMTGEGVVTPEEDIAAFLYGIQGGM